MYMIGQVAALRDRTVHARRAPPGGLDRGQRDPGRRPCSRAEPSRARRRPRRTSRSSGLGCILPGAADLAAFWANILDKVDAITEIPAERWDWREYYDPDRAARDKVYSRWGGFVDDVPFDPLAFGMPPNSLRLDRAVPAARRC